MKAPLLILDKLAFDNGWNFVLFRAGDIGGDEDFSSSSSLSSLPSTGDQDDDDEEAEEDPK